MRLELIRRKLQQLESLSTHPLNLIWLTGFGSPRGSIHSANEPSGYFSLEREMRLHLLKKCARAGVTHWFAGHYHRNAGGIYCLQCEPDAPPGSANKIADALLEVVRSVLPGAVLEALPGSEGLLL
jgi:hypothetical protein